MAWDAAAFSSANFREKADTAPVMVSTLRATSVCMADTVLR